MRKLTALLLSVLLCMCLLACGDDPVVIYPNYPAYNTDNNITAATTMPSESIDTTASEPETDPIPTDYKILVRSISGMPLENTTIFLYADDTLTDLVNFGKTDANGEFCMTLPASNHYAIVLDPLNGYTTESVYYFTNTTADITLATKLLQGDMPNGSVLRVGDVMYDFTVTTPDGTKITLSELLKEKDMVLLNFWYTTCSWCVTEFPYMEEAYQMYKDDVAIVGLNPTGETDSAIASFPSAYNLDLTFPLAACPSAWANTFDITGYPTSVVIDRYGVICLIEAGAITSLRPFVSLFDTFTGDEYTQKLYNNVGELVTKVKPTYEMASSEEVAAILNSGEIEVSYRAESGESAEYSWPFIEAEKNGDKCLKASNQQIDDSFAILYADVTLKAGQALGFDFLRSTEANADVMYVIVNNEDILSIHGSLETEKWETCYPVVAVEDGVYEVALCYIKDESTGEGDDTVYVKNFRVVDQADIDVGTHGR